MKKCKFQTAGILVIALVFGMMMMQTGCASAPPTAFELAESLEGTAWVQGSILIMNDKTTGELTDRSGKKTAFTYSATFDAKARTFKGNIKLEEGKYKFVDFSAKKYPIVGWLLDAKPLEEGPFAYATPERLGEVYKQMKVKEEVIEKYGSEYLGLNNKLLKRDGDNIFITYDHYGLHQTTNSAMEIVRTAYKLHSKDGVTMTLLSMNTSSHQYAGTEGAGTFNISINGDTVTISGGTGAGTAFNGTYKIQ